MTNKILMTIGAFALGMQITGCSREVSFAQDVQPILQEKCLECHGGSGEGTAASGFSVRDYESVMKGTKFGPVVVPGSSIGSTLYLVVAQKTAPEIQMPPHDEESLAKGRGTPLSKDQIEAIEGWIDQGAKNN